MPRLERWCVKQGGDGWQAPEIAGAVLIGHVFGHPRKPDGELIRTSRLVAAEGRTVTTEGGTVYTLGEPWPEYLAWMAENGVPFDPENRVKVRRQP